MQTYFKEQLKENKISKKVKTKGGTFQIIKILNLQINTKILNLICRLNKLSIYSKRVEGRIGL